MGGLLVMVALVMLGGCATQRINTRATVDLPEPVRRLLVVYQPVDMNTAVPGRGSGIPTSDKLQAPRRSRIIEMLGTAVAERLPAGLEARGINVRFVEAQDISTVLGSQAVRSAMSHVLLVRAQEDLQICALLSCSHRMTVRVVLFRSGQPEVIWRTDLMEPYMNSAFIYQARYNELADHILKALQGALTTDKQTSRAAP